MHKKSMFSKSNAFNKPLTSHYLLQTGLKVHFFKKHIFQLQNGHPPSPPQPFPTHPPTHTHKKDNNKKNQGEDISCFTRLIYSEPNNTIMTILISLLACQLRKKIVIRVR